MKELDERHEVLTVVGEEMEANALEYKRLASQIDASLCEGRSVAEALSSGVSDASHSIDELTSLNEKASEACHDTAQMLGAICEQRDLLASHSESFEAFAEQIDAINSQLQQVQTRSDSFSHQLNSLLADPRKIVEEAKGQATHLDGVCKAVRKVFAGLSQASLQANRDIARFAKISHNANDKLTELTSETWKAGQTLREWVDEAVHAQSRLSKSIGQIPPIGQTHPTSSLEKLADNSARAIPEILTAKRFRRDYDSVDRSAARRSVGVDHDDNKGKSTTDDAKPMVAGTV
jgi:methyl-accepting chemotaxis protein